MHALVWDLRFFDYTLRIFFFQLEDNLCFYGTLDLMGFFFFIWIFSLLPTTKVEKGLRLMSIIFIITFYFYGLRNWCVVANKPIH